MRFILVLVLIGFASQGIFADGQDEPSDNRDLDQTFNNMRLEQAELRWSSLALKLSEELTPNYDRLSDRLDKMELQISTLQKSLYNN